jgi:hypothetical protein
MKKTVLILSMLYSSSLFAQADNLDAMCSKIKRLCENNM